VLKQISIALTLIALGIAGTAPAMAQPHYGTHRHLYMYAPGGAGGSISNHGAQETGTAANRGMNDY